MSGQPPPSDAPQARRNLPWQQRRPVSSTFKKPAPGSPLGLTQSHTLPTDLGPSSPAPGPSTELQITERSSPPLHTARSNNQLSVSSLTKNFATPSGLPSLPVARHVRTSSTNVKGTFAPSFIKDQFGLERRDSVSSMRGGHGIAGESSDFSGRRWVWVKDPVEAFVKAEVLDEQDGMLTVRFEDLSEKTFREDQVDRVNPAKFDKADDMAELTHLNEASVVHNLRMRYQSELIYTYSGLFLVAVNPYTQLPIYNNEYIAMYKNRQREETKPHIFAVTDLAFRSMLEEKKDQSILVTGESGAGKTENTKKVIQYLAAVAIDNSATKQFGTLENQILQANPILEAFGNAQTLRNNNSSRFGKFIRIEFTRSGQIAGAFIDWYLLEKSRVITQHKHERNYHIFYQLLSGAPTEMRRLFLLGDAKVDAWEYLKSGSDTIAGVDDRDEFNALIKAFEVMGFTQEEQESILRVIAAVLHIGNLEVVPERRGSEDARFPKIEEADRICHTLGIPVDPFVKGLLRPRVKAGREWVNQSRNHEQVRHSLESLAKSLYERGFGKLVEMVNGKLDTKGDGGDFIGVLDIAGFEIFESNSFEQLCINYTNEKLQQFFNHHMFVLEQDEYARERIEWKFIDFGHDLQPTIDLIELPNPIGIFSCLDEDCVMPKATDVTFTEKLHSLWDGKTTKYKRSLLSQGFILTHYAADVEYDTTDWLQKNKDPLNDNVTRLLANSSYPYIASLFSDYSEDSSELSGAPRSRVKKGLFRTVAQRHKEQLSSLMSQLNQTHPHFVRCIIPNHQKKPRTLQAPLVLDQLRCNGVLEGIRIARTGFPNRMTFTEFRQRYEVLSDKMPKSYLDGQKASQMLLEHIDLDPVQYRVGISKVFFRSGILAELEERRDALVREIITRFQSHIRGYLQRRIAKKLLYRSDASLIIQRTFRVFLQLKEDPWWQLHQSMKPLLGTTQSSSAVKKRDELIQQLEIQMQAEMQTRQRLEEERRKTDSDLQRVQKTLESERALALDKEEIFIRLQQREADLTEKLAGALDDQDALEDQIDELMIAKRKAEDQSEAWRKELEQAGELIAKLEEEKNDLMARLDSVERQLAAAETARTMRTDAEDKLEQEIELLRSRLQLEERKVEKLQNSLAESDSKLDEHLSQTNLNLQQGQQQIKNLVEENRELRNQLAALSSTSTSFEDLVRRKESELNMLHSDLKKGELERKVLEDERRKLTEKHDEVFGRLRGMQSELESLRNEKHRLEKAAADANRLLESKISDEMESGKGRQLLDKQIRELKTELLAVQEELNQERQSRNEIAMNNENQYNQLKRENESLQMMKEAMEKDLMIDRENLRHALQNRSKVEQQKRQLEQEQKALKERVAEAEIARAKAQEEIERAMSRQVQEKEQRMEKDLRAKEDALAQADSERKRLAAENARLTRAVDESEFQRQNWENTRRRIEQDTAQLKNRLLASENDNRALQNTIQQKNLEISKANAKASETYRNKIVGLTAEKTKAEGENVQLRKQLEDAQIQIRSLEKQKEKLTLNLEDLNHEVSREHKTTRGAEKTASQLQLQLAEANRNLEMERQLKTQAQANAKQIQSTLATTNSELEECHHQLLVLQKVFDPEGQQPPSWESGRRSITHSVDLAMKLEEANQALRVSDERLARAEKELTDLRKRHQDELQEMDSMHSSSKRALLEEFNQNGQPTDKPFREPLKNNFSNHSIPTRRNFTNASDDALDSNFSDKTDSLAFRKRVDLASELEEVQNQLHVSEMRNKHLQAKIDSANEKAVRFDEHNDARRAIKLEKENNRLHDLLDDSSRKNSALEASMQSIELSLKDIQAKTHEELYDYISQQDVARKNLVNVHHEALNDLAWAKEQFERLKAAKATLEIDLRQTQIELDESLAIQQQDKVSRAQLLNEFADLQIRLDAESSKVADLQASMNLYKARSEEYFSKLEQAEISVLKATRSEAFTRSQAREAEEHTAAVMAERKKMESLVEDLQRQNQHYEEKIEDLSADLNMALQAKKRLHNELEDYRSRRAADLEDKESSMEQTRKKYQSELSTLTGELEIEREALVQSRAENRRLREEVEDLRAKWDDEVLNSSTWAKEKSRLEIKLQDITQSHDETMLAHNELQSRVVTLLAQVRSLRANIDEVTSDRDLLQKEKRSLEQRLAEAGQRLEDLANGESPAMRNAAQMDREILDIKGALARQEDIANTALERMKKSDALAEQSARDIAAERENNVQLHKEKAQLEKQVKDLQLKLVDLETKSYSSTSHDIRFLNSRVQELEQALEAQEATASANARNVRNVDRTVKDLQQVIDRRDYQLKQMEEELLRNKDKLQGYMKMVEDLQTSESEHQLLARKAERDAKEEREKSLRLERELEGWKGLRLDRNHGSRAGTLAALSEMGEETEGRLVVASRGKEARRSGHSVNFL